MCPVPGSFYTRKDISIQKMSSTLAVAGNKRLNPEIGFDLANGGRRGPISDDYMNSARGGSYRQSDFSTEGGGSVWGRDASKRFRSNGLHDTFGSTSRSANGPTTFQLMSHQGTTDAKESLEYQPVWGQRLDVSFLENDPFQRNTSNAAGAPVLITVDSANCPLMRVLTQANLNLLLSHETVQNNLINGRRRSPTETLVHLGITFLGFVQAVTDYATGYRLFTIFCAGYGMAGLSTVMRIHNAGSSIWLGTTRMAAADALKKGMGTEFVIGAEKRIVPAPNTTAGSTMVADPVQVHFVVGAEDPYAPAGQGTYCKLGRVEKVDIPGAQNAAESSRKDGLGTATGRYQIILKAGMSPV